MILMVILILLIIIFWLGYEMKNAPFEDEQ
jgi:hypothetical protein